ASALLALERAPRDEPGRRLLVLEIHPVLPAEVEGGAVRDRRSDRALADILDVPKRALEPRSVTDQPHVLPHHVAELLLEGIEILAVASAERRGESLDRRIEERGDETGHGATCNPVRHHVSRDAAEHGGVGDPIAAEAVGTVNTPRVLTRGEQSLHSGATGWIDHPPAHHEVGGRAHLHGLPGEVAPEISATTHHPAEAGLDRLGAKMRDVDPDAAVRTASPFLHFREAGAGDEIPRG